jgi:hypothetical protein
VTRDQGERPQAGGGSPAQLAEAPAWALSDVVAYCSGVREATAGATVMEDAAGQIVRYLRKMFRTTEGRPAFVLARLFNTAPWEDLPDDLRDIVHPPGSADDAPVGTRSLVLLASDGELPEWSDRRLSVGHRAVHLASAETVAQTPMIAALVREMGIDVQTFLGAGAGGTDRTDFGVFHVEDALDTNLVPAREFVVAHGIRSIVGFGGILPTGNVFSVVLFSRVTIGPEAAEMLRAVGVSVKLALVPFVTEPMFGGGRPRPADELESARARIASLDQMLRVYETTIAYQAGRLEDSLELLHRQDRRLRREAGIIDTLHRVGSVLGADLDMNRVVQEATDAVVEVTGAAFGAFFHNEVGPTGESYVLYTLSGVSREAFAQFPMPRNTAVFAPTFVGSAVVRSPDITADPRYGGSAPFHGMPPGHLPVRSYLAVPVISATGVVHGGIFLGHPDVGVFDQRAERLAVGVAAQAAAAIDNALLYTGQRRVARALQANLLTPPPSTERFSLAVRYVPALEHAEVGGDWYDSFVLPSGETTVVVGDVVGHDLTAASCMAQLRNVVRAVAVDRGGEPGEIVRHADEVVAQLRITNFATLIFGRVEELPDGELQLRWTIAGHPPPLLVRPNGTAEVLRRPPNLPLGIRPGEPRQDHVDALPAGSTLLLYTDGLVEGRGRLFSEGLERLVRAAERHAAEGLERFCDAVIADLEGPQASDDIALIALRVPPAR